MQNKLLFLGYTFIFTTNLHAQFTYKIKADSVKITNDSCPAELILKNSTKNVKGFLYNYGNGRTEFRQGVKKSMTQATSSAVIHYSYAQGQETISTTTIQPLNPTRGSGLLRTAG